MKPPLEYRQQRSPASSSGRTADFGSVKGGSNPPAGTKEAAAIYGVMRKQVDTAYAQIIEDAIVELARKRALKAAQMRRYRAKKAAK